MGVPLLIGVLVVDAMRRDPENRPSLEREGAADGQEVLEWLRGLVTAVCVQPVIPQADAETDSKPVEHQRHDQIGPREEKQGGNGGAMECDHGAGCDPVEVRIGVIGR